MMEFRVLKDIYFYCPDDKIPEKLLKVLDNSLSVSSGSGSYLGFDIQVAFIDDCLNIATKGQEVDCLAIFSQSRKLKDPTYQIGPWYVKFIPGKQMLQSIGCAVYDSCNI